MNTDIVIFYLAVGGLSELIIMRYPTPGERFGSIVSLIGTAVFLGYFVPHTANAPAMVCVFAARFGTVLGKAIGWLADGWRMYQIKRDWDGRTIQRGRPES